MASISLISFNAGEVSPKIDARSDVNKYSSACRRAENLFPLVYGPAEKRPGFKFVKAAKNSPEKIRMIAFIFSAQIAYMCEFGDQYIRFYFDGVELQNDIGNHVEIASPYALADLPQLQMKQFGDVMWITHPSYAPYKLSRLTATSFVLDKIVFDDGPFLVRNDIDKDNDVTMTSSVTAVGTTGTLTASSAFFETGHVGALFKLLHQRAVTEVTQAGAGTSDALDVKGSWSIVTSGRWAGVVNIQRNEDGKGFEDFRTYTGLKVGDKNIRLDRVENEERTQYRINAELGMSSAFGATLQVFDNLRLSVVRINSLTSSTVANITVIAKVEDTSATVRWAEGAWSVKRKFPASVAFFEGRVVYAGPGQTVWLSATDDFEKFVEGVNDADAFVLPLTTTNSIQWINTLEALVVGTSGDEWAISASKLNTTLTPTNFDARVQTTRGSRDIQSIAADVSILFADTVGRKIREMTFSDAENKYVAPDLTVLAEHITETGITAMAYQKNPDSMLWCVLADGGLLSMTYERDQDVVGWAKHFTGPVSYPFLRQLTSNRPTEPTAGTLTNPITISTPAELQNMAGGHYQLANDIDLGGFAWVAIPTFSGILEGNGKTIRNLLIDDSSTSNQGLFAILTGETEIRNLNFVDCSVTGQDDVGILFGEANISNIDVRLTDLTFTDCTVIARMDAGICFGDLTARLLAWRVTITDCTVTTNDGGCGVMFGAYFIRSNAPLLLEASIVDCSVIGGSAINNELEGSGGNGGFAGEITGKGEHIVIHSCYSTATVTATRVRDIGGFVGLVATEVVFFNCYATGNVTGGVRYIGGFIGFVSTQVEFTGCYATGNVLSVKPGLASNAVGGFVGYSQDSSYTDCFAAGNVTGTPVTGEETFNIGCFVGEDFSDDDGNTYLRILCTLGQINGVAGTSTKGRWTQTFWNEDNENDNLVGVGKTTTELQTRSTYTGWDLREVWLITAGVISVAVIPGTDEDEVWIAVQRKVNGQLVTHIEQMQPRLFGAQEDAFFVDSGVAYDGVETDTITGLGHLEGEEVVALADGAVFPTTTVSNAQITLSSNFVKAAVGLRYSYNLEPMRTDVTTAQGTSKGKLRKIARMVISFLTSSNVQYSVNDGVPQEIPTRTTEAYDDPPVFFTGDVTVTGDGGFEAEDTILITSDDPVPCTVRGIIPDIDITGPKP